MSHGEWHDCPQLLGLAFLAYVVSDYRTDDGLPNVVDVGANIGSCSLYFQALGICPVSFEPAPENMRLFAASMAINHFKCPGVVFAGTASEDRVSQVRLTRHNRGHAVVREDTKAHPGVLEEQTINQQIQLTRVDSVVSHHVHFMKVDTQGFEAHAIYSAEKMFREFGPPEVIHFEINPVLMRLAGTEPMPLIKWLHNFSYTFAGKRGAGLWSKDYTVVELSVEALQSHVNELAKDGFAEADYVAVHTSAADRIHPAKVLKLASTYRADTRALWQAWANDVVADPASRFGPLGDEWSARSSTRSSRRPT